MSDTLAPRDTTPPEGAQRHDPKSTGRFPGLWATTVARSKVELTTFFRNRTNLVFTMLFPVILLVVFGAVFLGGDLLPEGSTIKSIFIPGIIATGVMSTCFSSLANQIAADREEGLIRRLADSPMPKAAYFLGMIVKAIVTTVLEVALLVVLAILLFDFELPTAPGKWAAFAWVTALGVSSCSLLGIAYTALIPNARTAPAVTTPPFIVLQFVSGIFFPLAMLPSVLQIFGQLFPLAWMATGLRYAFLPDFMEKMEPTGSWELPLVAMVLIGWTVLGAVLAAVTFKWRGPKIK